MAIGDFLSRMLSAISALSPREGALWAGYALFLAALLWLIYVYFKKSYRRQWYGPPLGLKKAPGWDDVRYLMQTDPLDFGEKGSALSSCLHPRQWTLWMIRDVVLLPILAFGVWKAGAWIDLRGANVPVEKLASIATVVGAGSIFVAVFGIFYQGRVKARSENRQKWINELRQEMNAVIADIPHWWVHQHAVWLKERQRVLEERHAKIELYLNPSERIHRAFMALTRYMYGVADLDIDKNVFEELWQGRDAAPDLCDEKVWKATKSDIIRLANVLLKREWEQVKSIS